MQERYGELKIKIGEKDTEQGELRREVEVLKMQLKEKDKELSGFANSKWRRKKNGYKGILII